MCAALHLVLWSKCASGAVFHREGWSHGMAHRAAATISTAGPTGTLLVVSILVPGDPGGPDMALSPHHPLSLLRGGQSLVCHLQI